MEGRVVALNPLRRDRSTEVAPRQPSVLVCLADLRAAERGSVWDLTLTKEVPPTIEHVLPIHWVIDLWRHNLPDFPEWAHVSTALEVML